MNSGYSGYSKSNRAVNAEEEGRFPLTKACRVLKSKLIKELDIKITLKEAKKILKENWDGEWHHSSKYCNKVNYYDVQESFESIQELIKGDYEEVPYKKSFSEKLFNKISYNIEKKYQTITEFYSNFNVRNKGKWGYFYKHEIRQKILNKYPDFLKFVKNEKKLYIEYTSTIDFLNYWIGFRDEFRNLLKMKKIA